MDNLISNYLAVQRTIDNHPEVAGILENLFEDTSRAVVMMQDITKIFPHENYLIRCWSKVNDKIQAADNPHLENDCDINDKYFYGCLYASIMKEDESNPLDSPVLITLTTVLRIGVLRTNEEFLKEECSKVLIAGLKRIHTRELMQWEITSSFLYDCLKGIKTMMMSSLLINSFIHMLMMYAGKHFNMVNNLALADINSPVGVLAFACLANLLVKDCDDKQVIIETMLEHIEHAMDSNNGLTSLQVSVKQSNFRQMIRQIGNALTGSVDQLIFGIIRVAERYPKSKTLVFIINQLPFSLFCQLANVIVKLCYRRYYQQMQMFCFNMLESPYLTEEQEEHNALEHLYENIAESIVWPMKNIEQLQTVVETIKLIYALLQIKNLLVRNLVLKITKENAIMKELMTYLNQYCNNSWKQEFKVMNQYYISVYCRLLILNRETWRDKQFVQFTSLMLCENSSDLLPCLNDIKALISSDSFSQKEMQSVILNSLAGIVSQTQPVSSQGIQFLKLLHEVIFGDLRTGNGYYNLIVLKTSKCDLLLKSMVKNKLIKPRDIESLSILCKHLQGWRLMSDLAMHIDFLLPRNILYFTEHLHEMRLNILKGSSFMHITRFFTEVLDRKAKVCQPYEKECLQRFAVFLEGNLINRSIPIHTLPIALITMRKYYNYYKTPLARLVAMESAVESLTCKAFNEVVATEGNFDLIAVFPRDVIYFAEMQLVFGDLKEFTCQQGTFQVLERGILYFPSIKQEFTHLATAMIQCVTKFAIRKEDLLKATVKSLCSLLQYEEPKIKATCIDCLYDIALFRTSSFDVVIPHIYDLLTTNHPENTVTALNIYSKLFAKEHAIPNDWQTFILALAISDKEVIHLLENLTFENFMKNLHLYFETYFIHIMFYSNEICDKEDYFLFPEYRKKILRTKLSSSRRHFMYTIIIKYFSAESCSKILTYIYKKLSEQYLKEKHLTNYNAMTEDILIVTYQALKYKNLDYPELSKFHYQKTINQIKKLENYSAKKIGNGISVDEIIIIIVRKLVHLLNNLNNDHHSHLILKLFHLLFAIIDWNYTLIFNAIVDEGMNGHLRKSILKLKDIFTSHDHIFHYNSIINDNEFQEHPIQSICNRI